MLVMTVTLLVGLFAVIAVIISCAERMFGYVLPYAIIIAGCIFIGYSDECSRDDTDLGVAKVLKVFTDRGELSTKVRFNDGDELVARGFVPNANYVHVIRWDYEVSGLVTYKVGDAGDQVDFLVTDNETPEPPLPIDY